MQPVEPNVPRQIVEGYTELGNYMAKALRDKGYQGITTNSTYDAWTPARAYSHYHGGVRILSETASARLATPVNVKFESLRVASDDGYDPKVESANFGPVWKGGEWKLRNITDYMTTGAFALLNHAADNRERWLSRFYEIGKEAVRPRKTGELFALIVPPAIDEKATVEAHTSDKGPMQVYGLENDSRRNYLLGILERAGVEVEEARPFVAKGTKFPEGTSVISMSQPYGAFAKALTEDQNYPDLKDSHGTPISPYDVTAHTLTRLMNVDVVKVEAPFQIRKAGVRGGGGDGCGCSPPPLYSIYHSNIPSMDEGWTRWLFEGESLVFCCARFGKIENEEIRKKIHPYTSTVVFPDQPANQILNGYAPGSMPAEYVGGVGKEGGENL
jgi:hypothetical protein